jgi:hypothetical protein
MSPPLMRHVRMHMLDEAAGADILIDAPPA